ncbi:MAG: SpoIIE family protein phosphatase [Bacteroidales bacterium]|nr:MAG: SpoIIE family protein phosphatase [Bacteroidales bacterium]
MHTRTKILLLLASTILAFSIAVAGYQYIKNRQEKLFLKANIETKTQIIDNVLKNKTNSFLAPVNDYSCWDEMVQYVKNPSSAWEESNLNTVLSAFDVSNAWIYNHDLKLIYSAYDSTLYNENIILDSKTIKKAFADSSYCHFFMLFGNNLVEVTGASIVLSSDTEHKSAANGYFIVAKLWDSNYVGVLEKALDSKIHINPIDSIIKSDNTITSQNLNIVKTQKNVFGDDIVNINFLSKNQLAKDIATTNRFSIIILLLLMGTFIAFFFAMQNWVSSPLKSIAQSLSHDDIAPIEKLDEKKDEFGEIASLIKNFFEQKIQLEVEIAERTEAQKMAHEMYNETVNLNHELQASEEELRQNLDMIMELNEMLSKQQKEITDSINYASHIQAALLPPESIIKHFDKDFFILFKPRNIVSGDFYWVTHKDNKLIIAIADCTGHGVPGGFMSMLGMAYLNEIVNQCSNSTPAQILETLRRRVIESLHQTGKSGESKDGMDISFCIIDFNAMKIQFAGAYNSLYIARKTESETSANGYELLEFKGDRMPIGYSLRVDKQFTDQEVEIFSGDTVYMFTDGYQDQISGVTRQKFNRTKMKNLLVEMQGYPIPEQKNILELTFDAFRNEYQQVDDILVFGMKV